MGSFTSAPKILNGDTADNDLNLPTILSREDLLLRCKEELAHLPPRIIRSFQVINGLPSSVDSKDNIRVMQWNVLSQALGVKNDNFVACPDEALLWRTRRWRMLEEILSYKPDILCLQEVDHFNFLTQTLSTQGFSGVFMPKPDSPCYYIKGNNGPDGCALFYDANKYELLRTETRVLEVWTCQSNQVVILCIFRRLSDAREFAVATTHLKARQGTLLSTLRNEQGRDLVEFVRSHYGNRPLILAGDFNAEPSEPVYSSMVGHDDLQLESSYSYLNNRREEPAYTTWKIREEGEMCHTIDYVFFSKRDFDVCQILKLPTGEEIGEDRIPSFQYPSDHFSLACDFRLKSSDW